MQSIAAVRANDNLSRICEVPQGTCLTPTAQSSGTACTCATERAVVAGKVVRRGGEAKLSSVVNVYYATDRNVEGALPRVSYGSTRSAVTYGISRVSIPPKHQTGQLEAPPGLVRIRFLEDPTKHVLMLDVRPTSKDAFFRELDARVRGSRKSEAFIFVHGFNVTFEDAVRRTGQMAFDLHFEGAPVLYSWPSQGSPSPLAYNRDEANALYSERFLGDFLADFLTRNSAENVYLIAHSMGNRPMTGAVLQMLAKQPPAVRARVKELVLAAPDIDAQIFRRDIAPGLASLGRPVTLYASSSDKPLMLSRIFSGIERAGDVGKGLIVAPGIETVDASNVDTGFMSHSYFADTRAVMSDIQTLFTFGQRAAERRVTLQEKLSPQPHWEFRR